MTSAVPEDLLARLRSHGQEHVLAWWDEMDARQRQRMVEELRRIDLAELKKLFGQKDDKGALPAEHRIRALPRPCDDAGERRRFSAQGEEALRQGKVAFLVVAGGQGTRLGFEHPKGMFEVGPISRKSLFQLHAEKILAARNRFGAPLPFLIMTSPATDEETCRFFETHDNFGLPRSDTFFFLPKDDARA